MNLRHAAVILTLTLCACGAGTKTSTDSGIEGRVLVGPTCPVETVPPSPQCSPRRGSLDLLFTKDGKIVARTRSDATGTFRVVLEPGTYRIEGTGRMPPTVESQEVIVPPHTFVTVRVDADSGIR